MGKSVDALQIGPRSSRSWLSLRKTEASPMTKTTCMGFGLALALSAVSSQAQTVGAFARLDRDNDRVLSPAEFYAFGVEIFALWDTDQDGNIDEDEFYLGIFGLWDVDDDGAVTLSEYDDGWSDWFAAFNYVTYGELDANADDMLVPREFRAGLADTRLYERWTYDGALREQEFVTALYGVYDTDSDGVLTQQEFSDMGLVPP